MAEGWRRNPWIRRLPLLIVAAIGIWLWKGGELKKRQVYLLLPLDDRAQIVRFHGTLEERAGGIWELLKSEERDFPAGAAPSQVEWTLPLSRGEYRVVAGYALRSGEGCSVERTLKLDQEELSIVLPRPGSAECRPGGARGR
ncbi:MAG: hypothetical protein IRZ16_17330 [Myxococcaceae bacterium]|nr:hypothetical protein [Myxococcaceae bacterium]